MSAAHEVSCPHCCENNSIPGPQDSCWSCMGSLYEAPTPECRQFECLFELPEPFEVHREDSIPQPARAFAIDQPDEHPQMPGYRKHYSRITAEETRLRAAFTASDRNPAP